VLWLSGSRCDLEKFSSFFVDDVEFYHDQGGVTLGREKLTDSIKKNICGKVTRELVPGTLQVRYMKAMARWRWGFTDFTIRGHEDTEPVGEGRFIHLWQYKDGAWKITRVISTTITRRAKAGAIRVEFAKTFCAGGRRHRNDNKKFNAKFDFERGDAGRFAAGREFRGGSDAFAGAAGAGKKRQYAGDC
jgi:hypothetical protein